MPLIPWLAAAFTALWASLRYFIIVLIATYLPKFLINLGLSFGVGYITYSLGDYSLTFIFNYVKTTIGGLPAEALAMVSIARIDEALAVLFGALNARIMLQGFSAFGGGSGAMKKSSVVFNPNGGN